MSMLPRIRKFCAGRSDIFHYEVEDVSQIGEALRTIARVGPCILVINGGDGTVQAAMTEMHHGGHFPGCAPPVAVLPNGKTNLIALDLGFEGDPIAALERIMSVARNGFESHVVGRELIALSGGGTNGRPVIGMFLGGAGLADTILFCRHKIYPLGLPNGISHFLTAMALMVSQVFGVRTKFLPPRAQPISVSVHRQGELQGRFALLIVTTLDRLLLNSQMQYAGAGGNAGPLKLMAVEQRLPTMLRALWTSITGKLDRAQLAGVHLSRGSEIRIMGDHSSVILDGELFEADNDAPIVLKPTPPMRFLSLAA